MAEQETSYDAIVRVEIAIEILNQARAVLTARVHEIEDTDQGAAEALRRRRRDLIELQQSIRVADPDGVAYLIAAGDRACRTRPASGRSFDHDGGAGIRPALAGEKREHFPQ